MVQRCLGPGLNPQVYFTVTYMMNMSARLNQGFSAGSGIFWLDCLALVHSCVQGCAWSLSSMGSWGVLRCWTWAPNPKPCPQSQALGLRRLRGPWGILGGLDLQQASHRSGGKRSCSSFTALHPDT